MKLDNPLWFPKAISNPNAWLSDNLLMNLTRLLDPSTNLRNRNLEPVLTSLLLTILILNGLAKIEDADTDLFRF